MKTKIEEIKHYVGDISTLCGAERFIVSEGKGKGQTIIRLFNGKYNLFIKQDKCLDIFRADYKGENIAFICKNGLNNPSNLSFLNTFDGGFLYTCGLDNIGSPSKTFIQHGSISSIPSENVLIERVERNNKYYVSISGEMKYTSLFGSKLILKRKITLAYLSDELRIEDTVENAGFGTDEYMLLYHFNLGYPLLDEKTKVNIPNISETYFVNKKAEDNQAKLLTFEKPLPQTEEEVFVHHLKEGKETVTVSNKRNIEFTFETNDLPYLTQWKSSASADYVLGIEPATTNLIKKEYKKIEAGEKHSYTIIIKVF
ncbi:MAG: aldose 1-epimerase family protein [Bacillales bacterium]|jgi:hypothetical protein|nr:aldose 1-epimerase family protein [Bacillales bacterium]